MPWRDRRQRLRQSRLRSLNPRPRPGRPPRHSGPPQPTARLWLARRCRPRSRCPPKRPRPRHGDARFARRCRAFTDGDGVQFCRHRGFADCDGAFGPLLWRDARSGCASLRLRSLTPRPRPGLGHGIHAGSNRLIAFGLRAVTESETRSPVAFASTPKADAFVAEPLRARPWRSLRARVALEESAYRRSHFRPMRALRHPWRRWTLQGFSPAPSATAAFPEAVAIVPMASA